jgi:polyphosphate kinase
MSAEAVRAPAAQAEATPRFFDRELSWVEFNARVLELARDETVPLLERLRFVAIFSSNLDEFFQVRVAGMLETSQTQPLRVRGPGEPTLREVLDRVGTRVADLLDIQRAVLRGELLPALAERGIRIVGLEDLDAAERRRLEATFHRTILPVLTPLAVGPGRPFPYISNLSLSLGVYVRDPESGQRRFARVKVPEVLPRFLEVADGSSRFLPIEQLMAAHLGALFPGMTIEEQAAFRVTRDADLEIEDDVDDLLRAVENELRRRRFGDVVRLEVDSSISSAMRDQLVQSLQVDPRFVYAPDTLIDHADLAQLANLDRPDLRYDPWKGVTQQRLRPAQRGDASDVFAAMREGDILVHHPYDSFDTSVARMIAQAVDDPDVVAIKHTIYRTSGDSPIVPSLIRASEQGKQAVALVELKARFDEETNIGWARALERAGVHVVYGFADLKTHAKLALIVRREGDHMRRYAHVGTGNYHPTTARLYTDFGLFTTRPDITADVASLFNYLTGFSRLRSYRKLMVAPIDLRDRILSEISKVVEAHEEGKDSRVQMKMNALVDRKVIEALYEASQAGVEIDLIVRGICCLRPGVPGLSDRIRVVSITGRFLEHARLYVFRSGGEARYFLGSADMMPRNLDGRVEVIAPVEDPSLQQELDEVIDLSLKHVGYAWDLGPDGEWTRREPPPDGSTRSVQDVLMERALERAKAEEVPAEELPAEERVVRLVPRRPGSATPQQ